MTGVAIENVIERASAEGTNYASGSASHLGSCVVWLVAHGLSSSQTHHRQTRRRVLLCRRVGMHQHQGPRSRQLVLPVVEPDDAESATSAATAATAATTMTGSACLAIPPVPQTQSQQTPTPRSPLLQQKTPTRARTADDRTLPLPLPPKTTPRASMDAGSVRSAATAPPNSNFLSQIQHHQVSKLSKAGPGPSKTVTSSDVSPSPLADPRAGGFARRFGSLARRRRTSILITTPPNLPGAQTRTGPRRDSTTDEVLCDSEAVGPGGLRCSAFSSRFSAAPSTPSTLHSRESTSTSGYSSSRDSGVLGRWGTIGRTFKGTKVGSKSSVAGPVPGLAVQTPGEKVERHVSEPLTAAANASAAEPVVVEEPEAEGDDEHEGSTVHSHTSPVLRSATAAMPAVVVQPPSQQSGAQHLPQDHHHPDSHGQGHGRKLRKTSKDGHHHDDEHDHHDELFRAVRLKGTLRYAAQWSIVCMFCTDVPRIVSRRYRPSQPSPSTQPFGVRWSRRASCFVIGRTRAEHP